MILLIVDDSKTQRLILKKALLKINSDWIVLQAENGLEGLKILQDSKIDVIISDWNMPKMNGEDFFIQVKKSGFSGKFGLCSTNQTQKYIDTASELGANFFIKKPFTPEKIINELSVHLDI